MQDFKMEVDDNAKKIAEEMEELSKGSIYGGGGRGGKSFFASRFANNSKTKSRFGRRSC
jgi:hypothetical protein